MTSVLKRIRIAIYFEIYEFMHYLVCHGICGWVNLVCFSMLTTERQVWVLYGVMRRREIILKKT